jgi:transitional endoplasmic reticulum ATPase
MSNRNDTLSLKILEAYTRDVGRGVARIDYESMDPLSASTGDVIEINIYWLLIILSSSLGEG